MEASSQEVSMQNTREVILQEPSVAEKKEEKPSSPTHMRPTSVSTVRTRGGLSVNEQQFKTTNLVKSANTYGFQLRLGHKLDDTLDRIGFHEFFLLHFYRQLMTELFGTFVLVTMGCSAVTPYQIHHTGDASLTMASITLSWAFTVATVVWTIAHVSGCFLNPAVTVSMCVNLRIPIFRCAAYIIVQMIGAVAGSLFHTYLRGDKLTTTCQTLLNRELGVDEFKGYTIEFFISFMLLFFVFATTDHHRQDHGGSHALMVGGVIIPLVNMAAELTGAGMNPARSFGPAFVHGNWDAHWVYWVAPITGGTCGGLFYDLLFSERVIAWSRYLQVGDREDSIVA